MKYRKKPVVIEAIQFDGSHLSATKIIEWVNRSTGYSPENGGDPPILFYYGKLVIRTLEGDMTGTANDWIIKGVHGEFYPCKPDIFEATHEPVDEPNALTRRVMSETDRGENLERFGSVEEMIENLKKEQEG